MRGDFQPARIKSAAAALLDVVFALAVMATLAIAALTVLNNAARAELARAYARQFRLVHEDDCPAVFGNDFWFSCASEARRLNGAAAPPALASATPAAQAAPAQAATGQASQVVPVGTAPSAKPAKSHAN